MSINGSNIGPDQFHSENENLRKENETLRNNMDALNRRLSELEKTQKIHKEILDRTEQNALNKQYSNIDWVRPSFISREAREAGKKTKNFGAYEAYKPYGREPAPGSIRTRYKRGVGLYQEVYSPGQGWQHGEIIRTYESVVNEGRERTRKYEAKLAMEKSRHERSLMFANMYDKMHGLPPEARARAAKVETDAWEQERNGTTPTPVELAEAHPMRYSYGEKLEMYKQSRERGDPMPKVEMPEGFQPRVPGGVKASGERMESQASFDEWHRGLFEKSRNPDNFTDPELKALAIKMQSSPLTYEMYRSVVDMQHGDKEGNNKRKFDYGTYDRDGNGVLVEPLFNGKCNVVYVNTKTGKTLEAKSVSLKLVRQFQAEGTLGENMQKHINYKNQKTTDIREKPKKAAKKQPESEKKPDKKEDAPQKPPEKRSTVDQIVDHERKSDNPFRLATFSRPVEKIQEQIPSYEEVREQSLGSIDSPGSKAPFRSPMDDLPQTEAVQSQAHILYPERYQAPTFVDRSMKKTPDMIYGELSGAVYAISHARRPGMDWAKEQFGSVEQLQNSLQGVNDNGDGLKKFLKNLQGFEAQDKGKEQDRYRLKEHPLLRDPYGHEMAISEDISEIDAFDLHFPAGEFEPEAIAKVRKDAGGRWRVSVDWPEKGAGYDQFVRSSDY